LTLILSEKQVEALIDMNEVVDCVEEAFRRQGLGEVANTNRTRSGGYNSVLSVMHATLSYLGRGGLKAYMSSKAGTRFALVLFDSADSTPLAVMGAEAIGRFRTGAASGVATKHLFGERSGTLAMFGSGRQAMTQVLAVSRVMAVEEVRVWSPNPDHRKAFARRLVAEGIRARVHDTPQKAMEGAQVASSITSSKEPFITDRMVKTISHFNVCGGNVPERSEITSDAVGLFGTVVVDDLPQAKLEYGDLIRAARAGTFRWESALELCRVVTGKRVPKGKTLFKSGGAALEDVAVASMLYDKALRSGIPYPSVELV